MTEPELKQLANEYVFTKKEFDTLKKKTDSLNQSLKLNMEMSNLDDIELDDGSKVCLGITKRESLDEDKLLVQLKKYAPDTQCIKTREYIDMDILEKEIYNDKLSSAALSAFDACRNVKEIPTITIKKAKKVK